MVSITRLRLTLDPPLAHDIGGVGVDPGQVNMGMAFVHLGLADMYQIKLPSNFDAVGRMQATTAAVLYILGMQPGPSEGWLQFRANHCHAVIEGAAYGAPSGQVPLAENRTSAAIAVMTEYIPVAILPPSEIKLRIFGRGNMKAKEFWPYLLIRDEKDKVDRDDAGAALACAFYAYVLKRQEKLVNG